MHRDVVITTNERTNERMDGRCVCLDSGHVAARHKSQSTHVVARLSLSPSRPLYALTGAQMQINAKLRMKWHAFTACKSTSVSAASNDEVWTKWLFSFIVRRFCPFRAADRESFLLLLLLFMFFPNPGGVAECLECSTSSSSSNGGSSSLRTMLRWPATFSYIILEVLCSLQLRLYTRCSAGRVRCTFRPHPLHTTDRNIAQSPRKCACMLSSIPALAPTAPLPPVAPCMVAFAMLP